MLRIIPCRSLISDRFPIASFVVHVPGDRLFEVVCTTDPDLLRAEHRDRRTAANFASSRDGGLLRAPSGQATYLVPPAQLRRFAGNGRLYYAVGCYTDTRGHDPAFTVDPRAPAGAPSIQLSSDFTGRSLARERLGAGRYGAPAQAASPTALVWGGDQMTAPVPSASQPRLGNAGYDDGFDAALWETDGDVDADAEDDEDLEGAEDGRALGLAEEEADRGSWEDDGAEDGERYGGPQRRALGDPTPASPQILFASRHSGFADTYGPLAQLPERAPPAAGARSLTAPDRLQILDVIAPLESREARYAALSVDPRDGLAWGLLLFGQRQGRLGAVLEACWLRDRDSFARVFGEHEAALRDASNSLRVEDRMRPVGGASLGEEPWLSRFAAASTVPAFQAAQRETADRRIFLPALPLAASLGLDSQRALAVVFDRCVHMGTAGAAEWILAAISPIRDQAGRAAALAQLGLHTLEEFQATVPGLPTDGSWTADTHAALLRAAGPPPRDAALFRMLTAARRQASRSDEDARVATRVAALCASEALSDDLVYQVLA